MFYRAADLGLRRFLGAGGGVKAGDVEQVATVIADAGGEIDVDDLHDEVELSRRTVVLTLARLEDDGAVDLSGDQVVATVDDPADTLPAVEAAEERRRQIATSRLEMMRGYAETLACRRRFLLAYFGEDVDEDCGSCDTCESGSAARRPAEEADAPYPQGSRVRHGEWGDGSVVRVEGDTVTVLFDDVGYKTVSAELSADKGPAPRRLLTTLRQRTGTLC